MSEQAELGPVQQTLFIPLAARAREAARRRPVLRDQKAAEILAAVDFDAAKYGGSAGTITVLRTAVFDWWARQFIAAHPDGTVAELGTGLNTRFERVDNGRVHWLDLDLPDTIALRRRFFADTGRRQMIAASVASEDWLAAVRQRPGPYFFAAEGVLPYLHEEQVSQVLTRIARQFPGALIALDTYSRKMMARQHKMAGRRGIAQWSWACDDPRSLERLGLTVTGSVPITRPPAGLMAQLPARFRLLPLAGPLLGQAVRISLLRAG